MDVATFLFMSELGSTRSVPWSHLSSHQHTKTVYSLLRLLLNRQLQATHWLSRTARGFKSWVPLGSQAFPIDSYEESNIQCNYRFKEGSVVRFIHHSLYRKMHATPLPPTIQKLSQYFPVRSSCPFGVCTVDGAVLASSLPIHTLDQWVSLSCQSRCFTTGL